ncbi:MAG: enoyl-CoA hydratase/isomerase family protein [Novosphingobium sp.]|nr:enoyl-CoA hydratase/isomerase family protein [Novosphingobium sp.]
MALVERSAEAGVTILTINRPEKRNSITPEVQAELGSQLQQAEADDAVRVVIITGAGSDFCVGGDFSVVKRMLADAAYRTELERTHFETAESILSFAKPTIAAVNGPALGFGAEIAAFCDMVVMSENAVLADPHVKIGVGPAPGALLVWPQRTSRAIAAELMLTGRDVGAQEARTLGLVNRVAPEGEALTVAMELARTLSDLPREGVMAVKAALRQSYAKLRTEAEHMAS